MGLVAAVALAVIALSGCTDANDAKSEQVNRILKVTADELEAQHEMAERERERYDPEALDRELEKIDAEYEARMAELDADLE